MRHVTKMVKCCSHSGLCTSLWSFLPPFFLCFPLFLPSFQSFLDGCEFQRLSWIVTQLQVFFFHKSEDEVKYFQFAPKWLAAGNSLRLSQALRHFCCLKFCSAYYIYEWVFVNNEATTTVITHVLSMHKRPGSLLPGRPHISSAAGDGQVSIWASQALKWSTNGRLQTVILWTIG